MKIKITQEQYENFLKNYNRKNENSITLMDLKNIIKESKKNNINELEMIELSDTSYSNLNYDTDGTQNDEVYKGLLDDINTAAKNAGVKATVTTAKTGHGENTTSNKVSRHMKQIAVDVALIDGIGSDHASNEKNGNPKFRELGNKLKDELVELGYVWNAESGNQKAVLWQTSQGGNHFNHLHISNKGNASEEELMTYANKNANKTTQKQSPKEKTWLGKKIQKIGKSITPKSLGSKIYNRPGDPYEYKFENGKWFGRKKGSNGKFLDLSNYKTSVNILNKEFPQNNIKN